MRLSTYDRNVVRRAAQTILDDFGSGAADTLFLDVVLSCGVVTVFINPDDRIEIIEVSAHLQRTAHVPMSGRIVIGRKVTAGAKTARRRLSANDTAPANHGDDSGDPVRPRRI